MSDYIELMKARHSVRRYTDESIPLEIRQKLNDYAEQLNTQADLNIQVIYDEPECFSSRRAKYGNFVNCCNYISMVGRKSHDLDERCGYFGELMVLKAQELGLNTCWVALTHGKTKAVISHGESEAIVIALGYGATQGSERKSKSPDDVSNISSDSPQWFKRGVEVALLAPTAINQQKFSFELDGNTVKARTALLGPCLKIDLGIVKCHFELVAGKDNFIWA